MDLILVRYGELALKGGNRPFFLRKLQSNMRDCLKKNGVRGRIQSAQGRLYVQTTQRQEALDCLSRVFGIVSLSPAALIPLRPTPPETLAAIEEEAVQWARQAGLNPSKSFRVRARRADKSFPLTSPNIASEVGGYVQEATNGRVDLSDAADLSIEIEVRPEGAFVYAQSVPGPGGLPLGIGGRAVALISGGIDSPVAAWMMMKRGCPIIPLHFRQNDTETSKMLDNVKVLERYSYGYALRPVIIEHESAFGATVRALHQLGEERWICVFCKRTLLRRAAELAVEQGAHAIITGESLGQVASQTLENIEAISYGLEKPVLRPVIGLDKVEITAIAQRIGTFDISTRTSASCPYLPDRPLTTARMDRFREVLQAVEQELAR